MRRIIPYIASNFQNDRIWLRRSKPSKREYQILLAVDDSSSMKENNCNQMAYESLAVISTALQKLECGQLGICRLIKTLLIPHCIVMSCRVTRYLCVWFVRKYLMVFVFVEGLVKLWNCFILWILHSRLVMVDICYIISLSRKTEQILSRFEFVMIIILYTNTQHFLRAVELLGSVITRHSCSYSLLRMQMHYSVKVYYKATRPPQISVSY